MATPTSNIGDRIALKKTKDADREKRACPACARHSTCTPGSCGTFASYMSHLYDSLTSSAKKRPQIVVKQPLITEKSRPPSFGAGLAWNASVEMPVLAAAYGSRTPQTRGVGQPSL
jgi:hypothetical protein